MKTVEGRRPIVKNKKYAPATGIQSDFEKVLTSFVETKSVRYEEFSKIWRSKKLSLICAGRQSEREVVEFMEECMKVAFKMFLPPYGFQARVGALYLLYGLYFTQPCLPKVKIRVTKADWVHIKTMQDEFFKQNHHDTNFILQKLLADGAFYFCAASEEPRSRYTQAEDANKSMVDVLRENRQSIDDLFSDESFEQLNVIHTQYHQLKVRLAGPDANRPDRSLDVLQDKFPASIMDQIQKHHERWNKKESTRQGKRSAPLPTIPESGEDAESDPTYQPGGSVGQRRARLKEMAFRGAKNKQRYKHRSLLTESSSPEKGKSPRKKKGRQRGDRVTPSVQRAVASAVAEAESSMAVSDPDPSLLHMPHLEVATEQKSTPGNRAGRKRKGQTEPQDSSSSSTATKLKKTSETIQKQSAEQEDKRKEAEEPTETLAACQAKPRKRGRPPKTASPSKEAGKAGPPRNQEAEGNPKAPKLRLVPLKIKDSGRRKNKQ